MSKRCYCLPSLILLLGCVTLLASCAGEKRIGLNQRIHHDDFEYRVTSLTKQKDIGDGKTTARASGLYYVVAFSVENRAMRVVHRWDNSIAYVVDQQGRVFENDSKAQSLLYGGRDIPVVVGHTTPAGKTDTALFVFDLPVDVQDPCLQVRGEFLMGDLFDGNQYAKTKVVLY